MRSSKSIHRAAALVASAAALSAGALRTQAAVTNSTWNGSDAADSLDWQQSTNWATNTIPNIAGTNSAEATFLNTGLATGNTVDLNGTITLAELLIGDGTAAADSAPVFTLGNSQNASGGTLVITGNGADSKGLSFLGIQSGSKQANAFTLSSNLTLEPATTGNAIGINANGAAVTISGNISEGTTGTGLLKYGGAIATLSGTNTYTGVTTVRQNILHVASNAPAGAPGALGNATSAVQLGDALTSATQQVGLLVDGTFTVGRDITVNNTGSTGAITLGANSAGSPTYTGTINLNYSGTAGVTFQAPTGTNTVDFQGPITGVGSIVKTAVGNLQIDNANNSYTGSTTIQQGVIHLDANAPAGANGALGNATSAVQLGNSSTTGTQAVGIETDGAYTVGRDITVNAIASTGTITIGANGSQVGTSIYSGTINLSGTNTVTFQAPNTGATNTLDIQGAIIGAGSIVKPNSGTLQLDNANSSYTGSTTVRNGMLLLTASAPAGSNGALGNATSAVALGDGSSTSGATPAVLTSGNFSVGRDFSIYNGSKIGSATLGGSTTNTLGSTFSGAIDVGNETAAAQVRLQSYDTSANGVQFSGPISDANPNGISTIGRGIVTLTSSGNSYSGSTTVGSDGLGGTLLVNTSNTGGGAYTVQSGTLGGNGAITTGTGTNGITVAPGATLTPGQSSSTPSTGTLTVTGDVNLNGTLLAVLDDPASSFLSESGALNLGSGAILDVDALSTPNQPAYILASYSTLSGEFASVENDPAGYTLNYAYDGNNIALVTSSVPEPAALAVLSLAAPLLMRRRRRSASHDVGPTGRTGFTLVELLVVIGILALLMAILLPTMAHARDQSRTVACLSNLHQIALAASVYAAQNDGYTVPGYADHSAKSANGVYLDAENFATTLINSGCISAPSAGSLSDGPLNRASPFHCPSGLTDEIAIHLEPSVSAPFPATRQAALAQRAWRVQSSNTGIIIDSWYGVNAARNDYDTYPFPCRRLPADNNQTNFTLPKLSQIDRNAETVFLYDGTFLATYYEATRIAARHDNRTLTNVLFFDGHAASVPTATLPGGLAGTGTNPFADVTTLEQFPQYRWRLD